MMIEEWGGGAPLTARVRVVEPSGFTKVSALGVEEQRVNIIGDFADGGATMGDGFRLEARIVVAAKDNVLRLPTSALFRRQGAWNVFAVRDGVARRVPVEIGVRNQTDAELLSGLDAGTDVILHPSDQVDDGVRVTVLR